VGQKRKQKEEHEYESRQQAEACRLEIDAGDTDRTHESKRQKMMGAMEECHDESSEQLHARQQDVLANPVALAVAFAAINEEEGERVAEEGRQMVAWKERQGGSSFSASAALKEPATLKGTHEGGNGGLEEDFEQAALLASLNDGKRRRTRC
jgi:hypothetical protein